MRPAQAQVMDMQNFGVVKVNKFELRDTKGVKSLNWEAEGWYGGDRNKLWIKTSGATSVSGAKSGEAELQVLYDRMLTPFWDAQVGVRRALQFSPGNNIARNYAVFGFQGLAPYWFELEPAIFVSEKGNVLGRFSGTYELLFTQRLIAEGSFEANVSAKNVPELGIGSGLNNIGVGLRLRYEISRKFAPYVGVTWSRSYGNTANMAIGRGDPVQNAAVNVGLHLRF